MPTEKPKKHGVASSALDGLFFLTAKDGQVEWQGWVLSRVEAEVYLVQLCEWIVGGASVLRLVTLAEMIAWEFFDTADQWRETASAKLRQEQGRRERELRCANG